MRYGEEAAVAADAAASTGNDVMALLASIVSSSASTCMPPATPLICDGVVAESIVVPLFSSLLVLLLTDP